MRIAQVVTVVTPEGAYGGPVRVAVNQAKALIALGHDVTIFAGTSGYTTPPAEIDGVPVRLFSTLQALPAAGFAGMTSPQLLRAVHSAASEFDLWHIHLARDLVTLPAAAIVRHSQMPYVVQCHGMIDESTKLLARPLDRYLTRPILRDARHIFSLTPREESDLRLVGGSQLPITRIPNGVPPANLRHGPGETREVLYLARLQARKRPQYFVQAALALASKATNTVFTLVGPDEGEGGAIRNRIAASPHANQVRWTGALPPEQTIDRMRRASIYVLPSIDEPFPMSVLEALSVGLPVVVTNTCGLAPFILAANAGIVVDHELETLTNAIAQLLDDETRAAQMGSNGRAMVSKQFSIDAVAELLVSHYKTALAALPQ